MRDRESACGQASSRDTWCSRSQLTEKRVERGDVYLCAVCGAGWQAASSWKCNCPPSRGFFEAH